MITNRKITSWETPVSAEADRPQRTASEMKAVFDGNSEQLKSSVNGLIDDLTGSEGAENIGSPSLPGIVANGLWAQIVAFFAKVFGIVRTDQPSNRYLNGAGQYTVPSVGAAANGLPLGGNDNDFLLKNGNPDFATKWAGAGAVRTALNVKDGADKTETAISDAGTVAELTETDSVPVLTSGLKKAPISALRSAMFGNISGIVKASAGSVYQAEAGTDYQAAITASGVLKGDGVGGVSEAIKGQDFIEGSTLGNGRAEPRRIAAPFRHKYSSWTIEAVEQGALMLVNATSPTNINVTIPLEASVMFYSGTEIEFFVNGTGSLTFIPAAGVTLLSKDNKRMITAYSSAAIKYIENDKWILVGALE